jgi:hypothetical protein
MQPWEANKPVVTLERFERFPVSLEGVGATDHMSFDGIGSNTLPPHTNKDLKWGRPSFFVVCCSGPAAREIS